jgi:hypothetical protein
MKFVFLAPNIYLANANEPFFKFEGKLQIYEKKSNEELGSKYIFSGNNIIKLCTCYTKKVVLNERHKMIV